MEPDKEPLLGVLRDDPAMAAQLRRSVKILADNAPDPAMARTLREVLSGNINLRDVASTTAFAEMFRPFAEASVAEAAQMSDTEKEELAERGRREIDAEYEAAKSAESKSESNDIDDDEYFRDRGSILKPGW